MAKKRRVPRTAGTSRRRPSDIPRPIDAHGKLSVLIEFKHLPGASAAMLMTEARGFTSAGFSIDEQFEPVSLRSMGSQPYESGANMYGFDFGFVPPTAPETYVMRGTVSSEREMEILRARPDVAEVWVDTPIGPVAPVSPLAEPLVRVVQPLGAAVCPIPPCDCAPGTPKGTMADVAAYLGVDRIWSAGFRGSGIVVGVLDSGITAQGRPVKAGETNKRIPRVIGGWPTDDWGTESSKWGDHGNMCATDVIGMAPDAQLFDLRIAGAGGSPGTISRALQAFNWAINQHRLNGTPHVLTNSWGIFQESWDPTYARNAQHPFTRKVVEAINEGILVLFAAGNCGDTCPDGRCGPDVGSGRSIWGANGHPLVMTVGAVNRQEQFIGYSSRGPAALDPNKPDFCSVSHFTGYFPSDSGTSAATPILAGVVALLKQARSNATQDEVKQALRATAKDIGPPGFDIHSGAGIVQAHAAFMRLTQPVTATQPPICVPTRPPLCQPTQAPPCPPQLTQPPRCLPTRPPICRPTLGPPCPPPTLRPPCPPRTLPPFCPPTQPPLCGLPTAPPRCLPPTLNCPRPTLPCFTPPGQTSGWGSAEYYGGDPYGDPWAAYYAASAWPQDPMGGYAGASGYGADPSTTNPADPAGAAVASYGLPMDYWTGVAGEKPDPTSGT